MKAILYEGPRKMKMVEIPNQKQDQVKLLLK